MAERRKERGGRPGSPSAEAGFTLPEIAKERRNRKRLWLGLAAAAAAVIVGVGVWQIVARLTATCGGGTFGYQGECVGATDGSYDFTGSVKSIEDTIKSQNAAAEATGDFVSIALLTPLVPAPGSDVTAARVRQQMEGAATAQAYLNGQHFRPAIRLLLANEGSRQQAWSQVADQLRSWPADQHLVAVVGVGLSNTETVQAARKLAAGASPLPMIGTVDTGDGLNTTGPRPPLVSPALSGRINGLVRVVPSVADEVTLLSRYYRSRLPALSAQAVLVEDDDPDDLYTRSLALDFGQRFGARIIDRKQFAPGPDEAGEFRQIANDVCAPNATSTPVVLYAGREAAFPDFIDKLRTLTNCPSRDTITVLTGADAESLPAARTGANPDGPAIDVAYPNITDSGRLGPQYRQAFVGSRADVGASWAVITYDAVTAAEQAAQQAGQGSSAPPTPSAVTSLLYNFDKLTDPVKGATGSFVITPDGDEGCQWLPLIVDHRGTAAVQSQTQFNCPSP